MLVVKQTHWRNYISLDYYDLCNDCKKSLGTTAMRHTIPDSTDTDVPYVGTLPNRNLSYDCESRIVGSSHDKN